MKRVRALLDSLVPSSLFARLILILLAGLASAQLLSANLTILERDDVTTGAMIDVVEVDVRAAVVLLDRLPREERQAWLPRLARGTYRFLPATGEGGPPVRGRLSRRLLASVTSALSPDYPFSANAVPGRAERFQVHLRLADGEALTIDFRPRSGLPLSPWLPYLLAGQLLLVSLTCWLAVRMVTRPMRTLAEVADALGPDLRPVEMPERGPSEVVRAARALNAMQRRIAGYVDERLRILAAISHDLQTPITRMRLRLEVIDDPQFADHLGRFDADLRQLQDLVREGIGYARSMHGKPEPSCAVDLDGMAASIALDYADTGAAVSWRGSLGAPVQTRPKALRRILCNLIDNALKYAGDAELVLGRDAHGRIVIQVLDQGSGIPADRLEAVFEPFYRLEGSRSRDTGGTGLGLAIARQLAATLPASLTLHNRPEGGLEARLTLGGA
jgi:signal transduction histidine kinase